MTCNEREGDSVAMERTLLHWRLQWMTCEPPYRGILVSYLTYFHRNLSKKYQPKKNSREEEESK